jgi:hypothetical protein
MSKADCKLDQASDIEKKMAKIFALNEIANTELVLSIDVKTSNGKILLNIVIGCNCKDFHDRNATGALENSRSSIVLFLPIL